jgi:hypothetical protein
MLISLLIAFTALYTANSNQLRQTQSNDLTKTEIANIMTTIAPLIYIKDQVVECLSVKTPQSFSDCQSHIKDPRASCCHASISTLFSMCFPIPTEYPALYKDIFAKLGLATDCPLLNSFSGTYNDTLIGNIKLDPDDAQTILNSAMASKINLTPIALKCADVKNPTSFESCSSAVNNTDLKCCYLSGKNGTDTVNTCMPVPIKAQKQMEGLFPQVGAKLECETH